ncbi:hypothetical protein BDV28DRAFT_127717 [Aspergillus coremiiformis]|uniref:Phenylacetyl-CoA ligase n=1 Tax=Aspergillus coremiiformis TaxID=138285 RepID=A0A5N6ZEP9_9EURO|nr:hypothetical protein BDV28DRAFT_127717 [Aspergillus coremiiformis]
MLPSKLCLHTFYTAKMVFLPPSCAGELPAIPDNIPISEFMLNDHHGRNNLQDSRDPFTCGITGKSYSWPQVAERVEYLARAFAKEFNWAPNKGTEWDKAVTVFSVNTIDTISVCWATHQLGGMVSPANAAYSAPELKYQLLDSQAKVLFTCVPLLSTALEAASLAGFPKDRIYLLEVPTQLTGDTRVPVQYKTVSQFIEAGQALPKLEKFHWEAGEGARRIAFLCYSSGTSGLPKGVMISHKNVIANVLQIVAFEKSHRDTLTAPGGRPYTEITLGLLPQSHIYALVVMCHLGPYRGDQVIVLPKFELESYLTAIQTFKIVCLFVVPPIIITMLRNHDICSKYDLSSVKSLYTGAAPLGMETAEDYQNKYPHTTVRQGYGLTETCTVVSSTHSNDVLLGSSGVLIPGVKVRLVSTDGKEITSYDTPGEIMVQSPSVVLGYHNNEKANKETFENGWMRTGDEAIIHLSPKNTEHLFIVDRIKELIKVKGLQVAPAELEAHLLTHPAVADCAVIAIPDEAAGEVPKALVVKSASVEKDDERTIQSIKTYVEEHKARHKWLRGGIRFVDVIPKSPSGKLLRRVLRDQEKELRRCAGAKL